MADDFSDDPRPHWSEAKVHPHHKPKNVKLTNRLVGFSGTSTAARLSAEAERVKALKEAQIIKTIRALVAKGDHANAKAEQFYIAAGQHLKTLKAEHAGTWAEWEKLLKNKLSLSTGRASELMQIADGRKTLAKVRSGKAESVRKVRVSSSLRSEESREVVLAIRQDVSADPREVRIAFQPPAAKPQAVEGDPAPAAPLGSLTALQSAWDAAPAEVKREFVETNVAELSDLLAQQRKKAATAAADRAVERTLAPPIAPIRPDDYPELPGVLDRRPKPTTH
jgi:hypothetical protein